MYDASELWCGGLVVIDLKTIEKDVESARLVSQGTDVASPLDQNTAGEALARHAVTVSIEAIAWVGVVPRLSLTLA